MSGPLQNILSTSEEDEGNNLVFLEDDENDIGDRGDDGRRAASSLESLTNLLDEWGNGDDDDNNEELPSSTPYATAPSSRRNGRRHPPPSLSDAHSPISSRLKDHYETQKSDWTSPPPPSTIPTVASNPHSNDFQKQQQKQESDNIHNSNEQQRTKSTSAASLVVCGVDGTVYTLDAYTGQLRGMFASGPALVYSSSPDDKANDDSDSSQGASSRSDGKDENYSNNWGGGSNAIANAAPGWKERIVPGLDGRLYNLFQMDEDSGDGAYSNDDEECDDDKFCTEESSDIMPHSGSYNLSPLPISVMDVVDSPISTCRPTDDHSQERQCGIVLGSKKTTVFAIDPITGKVQWTQDPQGRGGGRGFTTHPPPNKSSRGLTVLLQREDYAVRHLNTDGGDEVWKVELGRFSALDFDVDAHSQTVADEMDGRDEEHVVGSASRGTAATAANISRKDKKTSPILSGTRKHGVLHDNKDDHRESKMFHEDGFDEHSHFRGFPSVAFGEVSLFSLFHLSQFSSQ